MKRAIAFPILALLVIALTAAANYAVYQAGYEWFVQRPSMFTVTRNTAAVAVALLVGWLMIPSGGRRRNTEAVMLIAGALFGIGLAVQFRLGHDAPRQLSNDEIDAIRDSVTASMPDVPIDSARRVATAVVRRENAILRRDFEAARVDTRLAQALKAEYGETEMTRRILENREEAVTDNPFIRLLPVFVFIGVVALFARSNLPLILSARWRLIGFYGSLLLCVGVFFYLSGAGGIRGANFAPQELLKLAVPIGWAGFLIHYRDALRSGSREIFTRNPMAIWLYVLALLTFPLIIFIVMRDFGQFLTIGIAQVLLLAYFTRSALYIVMALAALLVTAVVVMGGSPVGGTTPLTLLAILVAAVLIIAWLERFRRRDVLWTSGALVLAGYTVVAFLAAQLPFVRQAMETPRERFLLWADLFNRHGDSGWWDRSRQVIESLYAFDAGGLPGRGLGHGTPFLIPKASSDFIFAAIGEELGIIGAGLIVLAFVSLAVIGLRTAKEIGEDSFAGLLVTGYILLLSSQAFVHIAGTMNILPMTGITLPLVSSGASSLLVMWALVGAVVGLGSRSRIAMEGVAIRRDLQSKKSGGVTEWGRTDEG